MLVDQTGIVGLHTDAYDHREQSVRIVRVRLQSHLRVCRQTETRGTNRIDFKAINQRLKRCP
jgi:hypothetical protein